MDVRYDAGRFGSSYKDHPKSDASIRAVPMAEPVAAAVARRLDGCGRGELGFCGPGGSNGVPRGARSRLSVGNYRRVYRLAVARAELPSWTRMAPRPAPHLRDDDFGRGEHAGWLHPFWSQIGPPGCMERSGVLVMEVHMDQKRVHALVREERDRLERLRWLVEDDETTFDESARPGDA